VNVCVKVNVCVCHACTSGFGGQRMWCVHIDLTCIFTEVQHDTIALVRQNRSARSVHRLFLAVRSVIRLQRSM